MANTPPLSEFDEFLRDGMDQAVNETLGQMFTILGKKYKGVPAPLESEADLVSGGTHIKQGWSIMIPLPAQKSLFPKGTIVTDSRGRAFKVVRTSEYRMGLNLIVTDQNR